MRLKQPFDPYNSYQNSRQRGDYIPIPTVFLSLWYLGLARIALDIFLEYLTSHQGRNCILDIM